MPYTEGCVGCTEECTPARRQQCETFCEEQGEGGVERRGINAREVAIMRVLGTREVPEGFSIVTPRGLDVRNRNDAKSQPPNHSGTAKQKRG